MSLIPRTTYKGVTFQYSEVVVFAIVTGLAIAAGVWAHGRDEKLAIEAQRHANAVSSTDATIREIRETKGVTETKVTEIQGKKDSLESRLLTAEQWDAYVRGLGDAWVFNASSRTDEREKLYVTLRGELTFLHQSVAEAQSVLEALSKAEALSPMLGIERVTIATDGDATSRRFSAVKLAVAVPLRNSK